MYERNDPTLKFFAFAISEFVVPHGERYHEDEGLLVLINLKDLLRSNGAARQVGLNELSGLDIYLIRSNTPQQEHSMQLAILVFPIFSGISISGVP